MPKLFCPLLCWRLSTWKSQKTFSQPAGFIPVHRITSFCHSQQASSFLPSNHFTPHPRLHLSWRYRWPVFLNALRSGSTDFDFNLRWRKPPFSVNKNTRVTYFFLNLKKMNDHVLFLAVHFRANSKYKKLLHTKQKNYYAIWLTFNTFLPKVSV